MGFFIGLSRRGWIIIQLGEALPPPFLVRLTTPEGEPILREPDLIVVLNEHRERLQEQYFEGRARPCGRDCQRRQARATDRGEKFYEYEAAGVPEYWIIDPERQQAEFAQRNAQGVYQVVFSGATGVYHSQVLPGFWMEVAWLWEQPPLPKVLQAWGLI
ncbi:MAG: hypothetical protein KatS3mg021_2457 [Fimbriimonadales bacterium]|nr:MAG: hypothetical protein KatS3mg021_2457 [Fimbriimonadales bacterium]